MKNSVWAEEELNFIKENYKHMSYKEMADVLDRTKTAVDLKVNRLGLKKSKYVYDESFFENIDTEEKAYWLGFIYADGYVMIGKYNDKPCSYEASIELSVKDIDHLKKFVKSLNGNVPIKEFEKFSGTPPRAHKMCSVRLYSKKMVENLENYGVVQNKTFVIEFPNIDNDLIRHFIRGYFDGDGSVFENIQRSCVKCNICCGSKLFIENIREELYRNDICSYIVKDKNIFVLYIGGMNNVDKFRSYIYKDSTIFLDRKFNRFEEIYLKYNIYSRLPR